ncbi:ABC transporter ATP-binding protein/permease [Hoeflea olei]|uniref:ABC transporter n=1 Tax=Hoeflea olei TaxID=1480615 RepID=A0A1C1YPS2_9HYPH|nr:ABC transporter ATP-binding protein [Hoeflea olei]OCW55508.1 ABC transporter [Hoeflea olei]
MTPFLSATSPRLRRRMIGSSASGLAITACHVLQGICLAGLVGTLLGDTSLGGAASPFPWLAGFAVLILIKGVLIWVSEIIAQSTAQATKEELRQRLLTHLIDLGPGVTLRRQTGDLQATIVGGVEAVESYYSRYLPAIIVAVIGCAGVLAVLALVDWPSALLLGAFVVAFPLLDRFWMRWQMPAVSGVFAAMGAFGAELLDALQGILTLKTFNASQAWRHRLSARADALASESIRAAAVTMMRTGVTGFVTLSGTALVVSVDAWRVAAGELSPFALFLALFLTREAFRPLDRLEKEFHTAWAAGGAMQSIRDLLALEAPVHEPASPAPCPHRTDIAFDAVDFSYDGSDTPALSSVSFTVRENEFVAIVGPSGAGKSTIATLLPRFFDPDRGAIRIGGTDIRTLSLGTLRRLIGAVSQDTTLFSGTIAENLRLANPDATEIELRAALEAAHLAPLINSLPQGLDTPLGERGAGLSGGQRQRLAIARALLKDAPILLLDEATSNVDPASEKAIQAAIDGFRGRRTLIVIAHRLSTVAAADRVLVFERGRLVEAGSPQSLAIAGGAFARLAFTEGDVL